MNIKAAAYIIGFAFVAAGLLGYISNPVIGAESAIFHTDSMHNIVHLVSGALFILLAIVAPGALSGFMKLFGLVYLGLGIWGLTAIGSEQTNMTMLGNFLHVNGPDNWLHIGLGAVIFSASFLRRV